MRLVRTIEGVLKPYTGKYEKYKVACPWLDERTLTWGVSRKMILEKYGVFCYENKARKSAYSGRVMIPVKDVEGTLYGYLGRHIQDSKKPSPETPKYLFPAGLPKSRFLFGAHELWEGHPHRIVYLVESPFCVIIPNMTIATPRRANGMRAGAHSAKEYINIWDSRVCFSSL